MVPQPRLPVKVMQQLPLTEVHLLMVLQQMELLLTEQQLPMQAPLLMEVQQRTDHPQMEAAQQMEQRLTVLLTEVHLPMEVLQGLS